MVYNCSQQAFALLAALAMAVSTVSAEDRAAPARAEAQRLLPARTIQAAAPAPAQLRDARQSPVRTTQPVRTAQIDSHGRYPFGQFRGGYRYPFSYPYYRYGGSRHYPFGVGPYGPYGSNYGGYSGNAYEPRVYGRPPFDGRPLSDAPPAPAPGDPAPPAQVEPSPRAQQDNPAAMEQGPAVPGVQTPPAPTYGQAYGDPISAIGGSPYSPTYGGAHAYGTYPAGSFGNNMWFGNNRLIQGFGYYPTQIDTDPYGPPSGQGFYGPQYAPQHNNFGTRNYGPAYPTAGGINGGSGYLTGW